MRMFMLAQNPFNSAIKESSERFPGKVVMLAYRPLAFEQRIHGLEKFVLFCLENAKFCRQNTIDAWLAFLDVSNSDKFS